MSGTSPALAQGTPMAQQTPLQSWVNSWLNYLSDNLPVLFIVLAVLVGTLLLVRGGGVKQAVLFAVGAALVFLLLTNLEAIAAFLGDELPLEIDSDLPNTVPDQPASPAP